MDPLSDGGSFVAFRVVMASPAVDQRSEAGPEAASTNSPRVAAAALSQHQQQQHSPQTSRSLQQHPHDSVVGGEKVLAEDSDLDPAAFLKSVRELSEKREREDNERFRKLEEEIEKGRQERIRRKEGVYMPIGDAGVNADCGHWGRTREIYR